MAHNGEMTFEGGLIGLNEGTVGTALSQFGAALLAVLSFKIFLALQLDATLFQAMVSDLSQGTVAEKVAAKLIGLDAVSQMVADALRPLIG